MLDTHRLEVTVIRIIPQRSSWVEGATRGVLIVLPGILLHLLLFVVLVLVLVVIISVFIIVFCIGDFFSKFLEPFLQPVSTHALTPQRLLASLTLSRVRFSSKSPRTTNKSSSSVWTAARASSFSLVAASALRCFSSAPLTFQV